MSRIVFSKIGLLCLVMAFTAFHMRPAGLYAFSSSHEFLSHAEGSDSCLTAQCHVKFSEEKVSFQHESVRGGKCHACHKGESYPNKYGLKTDQREMCFACHKKTESEIQTSRFIHGPIQNGDCTSCHDPHGSNRKHFLKTSYNTLCSSCHSLKGLYAGEFVHQPVKDGNCGLCHDPHASNFKSRLTDFGPNLCLACHEEMVEGMAMDFVHDPLILSGCSDCHDPHSGDDSARLKLPAEELCLSCHEEKENEISQYKHKHQPVMNGQCLSCHSPHFSERRYLLIDKTDALCYNCHEEKKEWKTGKFLHGPVIQGNCSACHNPHGSDNAFILRLAFPHTFYSPYEKGKYSLCFLCHKEALITEEKSMTVTNFRNGDMNLHTLHVHQKKGRTCRACHNVHASDNEGRIRTQFPFGKMTIPMQYFKTENGGRCIPGCHRERAYDRVKKVENITEVP